MHKTVRRVCRAVPSPLALYTRRGASTRAAVASKWPSTHCSARGGRAAPPDQGEHCSAPCTVLPYLIVEKIVIKDE